MMSSMPHMLCILLLVLGVADVSANPREKLSAQTDNAAPAQESLRSGQAKAFVPDKNPHDSSDEVRNSGVNPSVSSSSISNSASPATYQATSTPVSRNDLRDELQKMRKELKGEISQLGESLGKSIPGGILFIFISVLAIYLTAKYVWRSRKKLSGEGLELKDIYEQITSLRKEVLTHSGSRPQASSQVQRDLEAKNRARDAELEARRQEIDSLKKCLAEVQESKRNLDSKLDKAESELSISQSKAQKMNSELERATADLSNLRVETSGLRTELRNLKSALVPPLQGGLATALGDELIGSLKDGTPHPLSALACLGMLKAADAAGMEEEVLLSVIRQFSESLAAFRAEKGSNADSIQRELVAWADALNAQFSGRLQIRVPALGFPVDSRTMTAVRGATKVTAVLSWCIYNSKGSVFAPAKVA